MQCSAAAAQSVETVSPSPDKVFLPPAPPSVTEPRKKRVSLLVGGQVGVPIFLDVDRSIVKAGADLTGFVSADFGYFAIGGGLGVGWNPIKLDGIVVDGITLTGTNPLTRFTISVPEVRFQVPELRVVLPYVSGSFDINLWSIGSSGDPCPEFYCFDVVGRFTPGFSARTGAAFEISNGIHIDVGLRYSLSGKGNDFFERREWWLTPYVGVLFRNR